ncbi:MAG: iron hydrogenase [Patescibacteria group bacterium]|nr:iron hydrogenase [Patescibacteria group bacterium]
MKPPINERAIALPSLRIKEKTLVFLALSVLTVFLPTIIHSQLITGPLVNMSLILAVLLVGPFEAVFLGLMPSVFALASGLLPLALAPAVPFIMISNAIFIGVYHYLGRKNFLLSTLAASLLKFLFLYGIVHLLLNTLLAQKIVENLSAMMGVFQFLTAIMGAVLAHAVLSFIKYKNNSKIRL